jgi:predicted restriction endonuclease
LISRDRRRAFTITQKNEILYQQDTRCAVCHVKLDLRVVEYDHIKAWAASGRTITQNGAALCPNCHRLKTHKERLKSIDRKSTEMKPALSFSLDELSTKQLKFLAQKHHLRVRGSTGWNLWDGDYTKSPSKRQYIAKLKGVVTANDINALRKEETRNTKKRR